MALDLTTTYPGQVIDSDPAYPQGKAFNDANPGIGTPLSAEWLNDLFGFFQAILKDADITPSGSADTADVSQYLQGLLKIINRVTITDITGTSHTVDDTNVNALLQFTNNSAITVTLPNDTNDPDIKIGDAIAITPIGTGQITFAPDAGVIFRSEIGLNSRARYTFITAIKVGANTWSLTGGLET